MKRRIVTMASVAGLALLALATPTFAADASKEVTVTGEGKCGKCSLKETEKCQNVIEAKENGKTVKYYLTQNATSKEFHDNICKEAKKVTATGTVKEVDGKKELTVSKIEVAK
jgi:RecG-like helicase